MGYTIHTRRHNIPSVARDISHYKPTITNRGLEYWGKALIDRVTSDSGAKILVVGCGYGNEAFDLATFTNAGLVAGLDIISFPFTTNLRTRKQHASSMLEHARVRDYPIGAENSFISMVLNQETQENLEVKQPNFIVGNGYTLPFRDNSFDTIVATLVLFHAEDKISFVRELLRVAKNEVIFLDGGATFRNFEFELVFRGNEDRLDALETSLRAYDSPVRVRKESAIIVPIDENVDKIETITRQSPFRWHAENWLFETIRYFSAALFNKMNTLVAKMSPGLRGCLSILFPKFFGNPLSSSRVITTNPTWFETDNAIVIPNGSKLGSGFLKQSGIEHTRVTTLRAYPVPDQHRDQYLRMATDGLDIYFQKYCGGIQLVINGSSVIDLAERFNYGTFNDLHAWIIGKGTLLPQVVPVKIFLNRDATKGVRTKYQFFIDEPPEGACKP